MFVFTYTWVKKFFKKGGVVSENKNMLSENIQTELEKETNGKLMAALIRKSLGSIYEVSSYSTGARVFNQKMWEPKEELSKE